MGYDGDERRRSSDDLMTVMMELRRVAEIAASTNTNVSLLREEMKTVASCEDVNRVEKKINDHVADHSQIEKDIKENKRWTIGTIIAAAGVAVGAWAIRP